MVKDIRDSYMGLLKAGEIDEDVLNELLLEYDSGINASEDCFAVFCFGSVTGIFFFILLFVWICYVIIKDHFLPEKGLGIAISSSIIAHILVFSFYEINLVAGYSF